MRIVLNHIYIFFLFYYIVRGLKQNGIIEAIKTETRWKVAVLALVAKHENINVKHVEGRIKNVNPEHVQLDDNKYNKSSFIWLQTEIGFSFCIQIIYILCIESW